MTDCIAPELLSNFLKARPTLTQAQAAEQLNIVPAALTAYLKRKQRPRSDIRKRIERWTQGAVPESAWLTAEELVELGEVSAAVVPTPVVADDSDSNPTDSDL